MQKNQVKKILFDSRKIDTYPHFVVVAIMQQ